MKRCLLKLSAVGLAFYAICCPIRVDAATITWTNTTGGNWSVAANWSPNQVPGSSDDAFITANGTYLVTLDISPTINSLTLGGNSGEQTLTNASFTLTLNSGSMIGPHGVFAMNGSGGGFDCYGNLGVQGVFNWSNGQLGGFNPSTSLTIATNGVLNIEGNIEILGLLTNQGTVNWQGGVVGVYNSPPTEAGEIWNEAGALWDIQCDDSMVAEEGDELFHNAGVLQKDTTTGTTLFSVYLDNTAVVHGESGTLQFQGSDLGGNFQADANATIIFVGGAFTLSSPPTNFQGPGPVYFATDSLTLSQFTGTYALYNGVTLVGQNTVAPTGAITVSGSTLGPGASLTIASNGVLNIAGGLSLYGALTNQGTVNWSSGEVAVYNRSDFGFTGEIWNEAGALWDIQCDDSMVAEEGDELFHNAGVLQKDTTTGTTLFSVYLDNTAVVHGESGTLQFQGSDLGGNFQADANATIIFVGGAFTLSSPPTNFQGPGPVYFATDSLTLSQFTGTYALYNGVTLVGQNTVAPTGAITVSGSTLGPGASLTIASNGVLNIAGGLSLYGALTNQGTVNWSSGEVAVYNRSDFGFTGEIWNEAGALWDIQCDDSMVAEEGDELFHNAGVLQKDTTTGTTLFSVYLDNTAVVHGESGTLQFQGSDLGGNFQADANATIIFVGGAFTLSSPPTNFQGPGPVYFATDSLTLSQFTGTYALYNGVTLVGQNTVAPTGAITVSGSTLGPGASLTIASNGVLNIAGGLSLYGALTNQGTVNWSSGEVAVYNRSDFGFTGEIWNEAGALWDIQCDDSMVAEEGDELFHNAGVLQKDTTTGTTLFSVYLDNTAVVHGESGTLQFQGSDLGGNFQADANATIIFVGGAFTLSSPPTNFQGPGPVYFATDSLTLSQFTGTYALYNGVTLVGQNTVAPTGAITVSGSTLGPGASLTIASNGVLNIAGGLSLYGALTNQGTVNWSSGEVAVYNRSDFGFTGEIWNEAGALWDIQCDDSMVAEEGDELFHNAGVLQKDTTTGTTLFSVYLDESGTIEADTGTMSIQGGYSNSSSANLAISLGGATSDSGYGNISFSTPLAGSGTFTVDTRNGFQPNLGQAYAVLSYPSLTNEFTNFSSPSGAIWQTNYTSTSLVLTNVGQITWATPTNITYGTALGSIQLNASTTPSLAGTFSYQPAAGTVLDSGEQLLTVTFKPSNSSYAPASFRVPITVLQAPLGITATNQTKTYGQNFSFSGTEFVSSGLVNGDTVTSALIASAGAISNAPVSGSPYAITINNALGDARLTNYIISYTNGELTVSPAPLGITANSFSKTYGSNVVFAGREFVSTTLSNKETIGTVTLTSAGAISNAPVIGSPYSIVPSTATGGTFTPGNYAITYTNGALTINRAGLTVTANPASREYGVANPAFGATYSGFVNGETASVVSGAPNFSTPATVTSGVGNYMITPSLGSLTAANYSFTPFVNGALSITVAPVTIASGITANNKVYNRATAATLTSNSVVLLGIINGDTVSLNTNGYVANFASAGVGNGIAVTVSGLTLSGARATNYALTQPTGLTANITTAPVIISSGLTANNKVYNDTTTATLTSNNVVLLGVVTGDTVHLNTNGYVANFAGAGIGSGIAVTVSGLSLSGANAGNYALTEPSSLTANITAAPVSVSAGLTANNKVYDRTTTATLNSNNVTLTGVIVGDTVALNTNAYVANFASAGIGSGIAVTVSGLSLSGANAGNYALTEPSSLTANITAAPVSVSAGLTANNKVYDRTTIATLSSNNVALTGVIVGDTVALNTNAYVANFASAGVGNGIAVTVSGLSLSGASAGNYALAEPSSLTANITAAPVSVSAGLTANNKVYDRTTTATLNSNNVTLTGVIVGDTVALNTNAYVANFASAGVGNGIAVTVSGLSLSGASAGNYALAEPSSLTANITGAPVSVSAGLTANNKVYDRTTIATLSSNNVALTGVIVGDTVALNTNAYGANFASAGVGNGIAVTVSGLSLSGASAANYALAEPSSLTANITAAPVSVSAGLTANNKVYNDTTTATLSSNSVVLLGFITGDTVSLNTNGYVADFASTGVGSGIAVTVSGLTLSGASAANYTLTQPASLTANITTASVSISSGITANNKVYNGTTTATLSSNMVVLAGVITGDTVSLNTNGYVANFASTGVGNGIAVTVSSLTLSGASAANYDLTQPAGFTANITAATVTITSGITANNKVYNGTTNATLSSNSVVLLGVIAGDTVSLNTNGYVADFASTGVGSGIAVTVSGLTLSGASAANYALTQPAGFTANITAATVTITSGITANNKVYDRTTTATLSSNMVVLAGVVTDDTVSLNTNGYVANFASTGVGDGITVTVTGLTISGASAINYALTQPASLTANITAPAAQIITSSQNIVISWPTNASVFVLNQTASLNPPVMWSPVTNNITVNGTNNTVTISVGASGNQYFDLIAAP